MAALLSAAALACAAASASAHTLSDDSALGMILLGGYGDALGASTEQWGLAGNWTAPTGPWNGTDLRPFRGDRWDDTPWGTWPPLESIAGAVGVVTDDTSVRVAVVEPWLRNVTGCGRRAVLDEASVRAYMNAREDELWAARPLPSQVLERERAMLADFLCMFHAAGVEPGSACRHGGVNKFYVRGYPAVFGTYTYLELAALFAGRADFADVYAAFAGFSALDQLWGLPYTGLMGALVSEAASIAPGPANFTDWYVGAVRGALAGGAVGGGPFAGNVSEAFDAALAAGAAWRSEGIGIGEALERYRDDVWRRLPASPLKSQDPMTFLYQQTFAWSWCSEEDGGSGVACPLEFTHLSAGDTDTVSSQMGVLLGAYHGYERLASLSGVGARNLARVSAYLSQWYGYNASEAAEALVAAAPLMRLPPDAPHN